MTARKRKAKQAAPLARTLVAAAEPSTPRPPLLAPWLRPVLELMLCSWAVAALVPLFGLPLAEAFSVMILAAFTALAGLSRLVPRFHRATSIQARFWLAPQPVSHFRLRHQKIVEGSTTLGWLLLCGVLHAVAPEGNLLVQAIFCAIPVWLMLSTRPAVRATARLMFAALALGFAFVGVPSLTVRLMTTGTVDVGLVAFVLAPIVLGTLSCLTMAPVAEAAE